MQAHDELRGCSSIALQIVANKRPPSTGFSTIETPATMARLRTFSLMSDVTRIAGICMWRFLSWATNWHEQVLLAQSQQSAACNASHSVEARMCRWLLRMRDLAGKDVTLTQEFLAQMMGVQRPSVSIVANMLQKAGFIEYSRGRIRMLDISGLEKGSCECYRTVKTHYDRLLVG